MRSLPILLLALTLVLPTPTSAQDAPAAGTPVRVLDDPAGDVQVGDTGQGLPTGGNPYVDIRTLDIEERDDLFIFTYKPEGVPAQPEAPILGSANHRIAFRHNNADFSIYIWRQVLVQTPSYYVDLAASYGGQEGGAYNALVATVGDAGLLTIEVPRLLLADADGAPPFPGRLLEGFAAYSDTGGGSICILECQELAHQHDEAVSTTPFEVKLGVEQSGHARLASPTPYRATNGQAGATIFEVEAHNLGTVAETFDLSTAKVPAEWKVRLPQAQVRLDPGASATFPVLLEIPFQHVHGRLQTFLVEMHSPTDPGTVGRIELGLHFVDPPQPAGHHNAVYLHSNVPTNELDAAIGDAISGNGPWATMNTLETDPLDAAVAVPGRFWDINTEGSTPRSIFRWFVPLSPGLRMGIDTDLTAVGDIHLPVGTTLPMDNTVLEGYLAVVVPESQYHGWLSWEESATVATIPPTAATSIAANGQAILEGSLLPAATGDLVPFHPGQQLVLVLNVSFDRPATFLAPEAPSLLPGGYLTAPLSDYSDPVDQTLSTLAGLSLTAKDGQDRRAPPDSTAVYTLELTGPAGEYRLAAYGTDQSWVRFADGDTVTVTDGPVTAYALVDVPSGTPDGTVADFVVEAAHREMLDARAVLRLRLTADPAAPAAEDVPQGVQDLQSPAPVAALLGLGLLAAAWGRRRVYP